MWTKARLSRCYHQFICCHVCNVATGSRDRSSGSGASWDAVFCLLHKWSLVIMMQWYWYLHQELSKQKSRETVPLAYTIPFLKNHEYYIRTFLKFSRFSQKKNKFSSHKNLWAFKIYQQFIYDIHTLSSSRNRILSSEEISMHYMAPLFNYKIQKPISRMACWPGKRMLACHVVDLQFSLLLWLAKLAGAWRAGIVHTINSKRKCIMMLKSDHFIVFILGK